MNNKNENIKNVAIVILFYGLIFVVLYFLFSNHNQTNNTQDNTVNFVATPTQAITLSPNANCLNSQQASNYYGQYVCIRYFVGHPVKFSNGSEALNERADYWNGFSVYIPNSVVGNFGVTDPYGDTYYLDPYDSYGYKWIDVSGIVTPYRNAPEVIISSPAQISVEY